MVGWAALLLLLVSTLSLLGSPAVPASRPGWSQASGELEQQLDQASGASRATLVSVYVHLDFSNNTWPPELSRTLTLPSALTFSSPRNLTGLNITTECNANQDGHFCCGCLSGYQWNTSICSRHPSCQTSPSHQPCVCLNFSHPEPAYCQLLPPTPGSLSQVSEQPAAGSTLRLTLVTHHEATHLSWFLQPTGSPGSILLQPGTQVSLDSSIQGQAALSIVNISQDWAGRYTCSFEAQGFSWMLHQEVRLSLRETDVVRLPDQLSVSCATTTGFHLSCCIPSTYLAYNASWSPRDGGTASVLSKTGFQCLVLAVQDCPTADTVYTYELQSLELAPVRVPIFVTIIQDGDIVCPEESLAVTWHVTKAGYVAQAPCPMDRIGTMTRSCGPDGVWGPIHSSCTDAGILALLHKARLLKAGQGQPAKEVPELLTQLPRQAAGVTSPSDLLALLGTVTFLAEVVVKTRIHLPHSALQDLLTGADKILDLDTSSLWTPAQAQKPSASSAFLWALEMLAHSLCPQNHSFSFISSNVQLQTQLLGPTSAEYRISFSSPPPLQAEIPSHSLAPLIQSGANISITSLVLQKLDHFLPSNYGGGLRDSYATSGLVLSISILVDGQPFNQGEVIMDFGDRNGTPHCVFWDHDLFQGEGGWSDEGCQAEAAGANSTTQCVCQHLTAFSILMSRYTVPNSPTLELLNHLGLGASILALLVCLCVYRLVWRFVVRNKVAYFRHAALLNVVFCLLAADICFLGSSLLPPGPHSPLCLATAFFCHFLYLATFFWMLAQALLLAHQLLFVFHHLSKQWVLPLMIVLGYLCPLGFAGGALGLYLPQGQYVREKECWLDEKGGAFYTFLGPVLAIVGVNGLVLTMAVLKLLRPSLSEGLQVEKRQALLGVTKALLFLTPIFGLTWGLGLATLIDEVSEVPHYIFTILNTSQGVFILLFGCLMDKKVQEALFKRFCRTQTPSSTTSLATNESHLFQHSKGRGKNTSYEERMT